jgi:hypothetical protein
MATQRIAGHCSGLLEVNQELAQPSLRFRAIKLRSSDFAAKPGHPYCLEHEREMDDIRRLDDDWEEIEATHRAVCGEPEEKEQEMCAACNCRPTHVDCIYCEECFGDGALGVVGPQA